MKKTILFFYALLIISSSMHSQSFQWAQREGNQSNGYIIETDNAGNSYVYGRIFITTTIGGQSLNMANGDRFIVKYNNTGNAVWVKQLAAMEISDLKVTNTDLYITGRYGAGASFAGTAVAGGSGWDGYMARLDEAGNINWIQTITNPTTYESANSVAVDNSGNLYVTGTFNGASAMIGTSTITGTGYESMFLLKVSPSGSVTWSKTVSSDDGSATGNRIEVATSGDIYVMTSAFGDSIYYDSFYYAAGSYDAEVLVHYNNAGTAQGILEVNHTSQDNITGMTVDASGNIYTLQTNYLMSFTLSKYSSVLANAWTITDGGGGHLSVTDVEVKQSGQVVVIGQVEEDATFGGTLTVHDYGGGNGFLANYTNGGTFLSLKEIPGSVFMGKASLDAADNIYMTGSVTDSAKFDAIDLTTAGVEAMFVAKYSLTTGIASLDEGSFSVYPNPCSTVLNCELKQTTGTVVVSLFNSIGEKVYEKNTDSDMLRLDLSHYKKGIYLLNIGNTESTLTKRIVVD